MRTLERRRERRRPRTPAANGARPHSSTRRRPRRSPRRPANGPSAAIATTYDVTSQLDAATPPPVPDAMSGRATASIVEFSGSSVPLSATAARTVADQTIRTMPASPSTSRPARRGCGGGPGRCRRRRGCRTRGPRRRSGSARPPRRHSRGRGGEQRRPRRRGGLVTGFRPGAAGRHRRSRDDPRRATYGTRAIPDGPSARRLALGRGGAPMNFSAPVAHGPAASTRSGGVPSAGGGRDPRRSAPSPPCVPDGARQACREPRSRRASRPGSSGGVHRRRPSPRAGQPAARFQEDRALW